MRVALKFAYNGKTYHGYARQPNLKTVEGSLINTLIDNGYFENEKEAMFSSASRTDKEVSSLGSVIAFNTAKDICQIVPECNMHLDNIVVYGKQVVNDAFYPRYAKQRIYDYYVKKNEISFETIQSIKPLFIGTHNFSNFARIEHNRNPVRTINAIDVKETESFFILSFFAQNFLWHQIRRIISAMQQFEKKRISRQDICNALYKPDDQVDFGLAVPYFLILRDIEYDISFNLDENGLKKRKNLEKEIIEDLDVLFRKFPIKYA